MNFHILYFTATGNTERAVGIIERRLSAAGHSVSKTCVAKRTPMPELYACDWLVVAFPVLAKAPPVMFARFLKRLPRRGRTGAKAIPASVVSTYGGDGGWAGYRAADILRKRGFQAISVSGVFYPSNWAQVNGTFDAERAEKATASGDAGVEELAAGLAAGEPPLEKVRPRKDAMDVFMPLPFGLIGRRFFGKLYYADRDCSSCGLCARTCPAECIAMPRRKGGKPFWKSNCESCNRCINVCPEGAIVTSIGRIAVLLATVVGIAWALVWAYSAFASPFIASSLPRAIAKAIDAIAVAGLVLGAHFMAIGPFDAFVLRWLQRLPGLNRFFGWSFTKGKRRYLAKGFRPKAQ